MIEDVISDMAAVDINEKQGRGVMPTCGVKSWKYTFCQKASKLLLLTNEANNWSMRQALCFEF